MIEGVLGVRKRGAVLAGDHFTILIFSRNSANVKRYRVPKLILRSLVLLIPLLIILAVVLGLNFLYNPKHASVIAQFEEKNRIQHQEIRFFSERISELQNRIAQMREFDSKLRVIANLENLPSAFLGVGGPLREDLRERMRIQQSPDVLARPMQPASIGLVPETRPPEKDAQRWAGLVNRGGNQLPHVPLVWPTRGWIIGDFGCRISPLTGHLQMHEGIEISNSLGTPILAPAVGLVTTVGTDPNHGKMVVLSHGHGVVTRYGHLSEVDVKIGQNVRRGQRIGKMGNTGRSVGPRLYYEVRVNGVPIDPRSYLYN